MNGVLNLISRLKTYKVIHWDSDSDMKFNWNNTKEVREEAQIFEGANVVSSLSTEDSPESGVRNHALLLDLDIPAYLIPSSTPGHSHLYVDIRIPEHRYFRLLDLLSECGVIQSGFASNSKRKGGTCLRLPWVKKEKVEDPFDPSREDCFW